MFDVGSAATLQKGHVSLSSMPAVLHAALEMCIVQHARQHKAR